MKAFSNLYKEFGYHSKKNSPVSSSMRGTKYLTISVLLIKSLKKGTLKDSDQVVLLAVSLIKKTSKTALEKKHDIEAGPD